MATTQTTITVELDDADIVDALIAHVIKNRRKLGLAKCTAEQIKLTKDDDWPLVTVSALFKL